MSSCRCKEPENVINNVCERCLLPVCLMTPSKPVASFREFWVEKIEHEESVELAVWDFRPPFEAEFASCEKDFIHVIEYKAYQAVAEIERDFQLVRKQRAELTQRNQELAKALDRFCTLSNGLSFYFRSPDENVALRTQFKDLAEKLQVLYDHQCNVEASMDREK